VAKEVVAARALLLGVGGKSKTEGATAELKEEIAAVVAPKSHHIGGMTAPMNAGAAAGAGAGTGTGIATGTTTTGIGIKTGAIAAAAAAGTAMTAAEAGAGTATRRDAVEVQLKPIYRTEIREPELEIRNEN
jgi:hypothetical protein